MKKLLSRIKKSNKGFTLIELIIVIAIIAVLAAVIAPQYMKYVEKSRVSADKSTASALLSAVQVALADDSYTLENGDKIVFNASGIAVTAQTGSQIIAALTEYTGTTYSATASGTTLKSKDGTSQYTITVTISGDQRTATCSPDPSVS